MSDFVLVDPKHFEYDLHSVYSAYIGYFQVYNIPWYERSWGTFFESFDEFLGFSWPVIAVTDAYTGRAHLVTKLSAINAFIKMIKTRFGETLPQAPNVLQITPFETAQRRLRHVADYATFTRLHGTLPAALLAALKIRVRAGEPKVVKELWEKREKTFLAIDFEVNERNEKTVLEFGYAAVRCGHLHALGHWPPVPDTNYRKGHYIVSDHVDKIVNKHSPTYPWQYAFGDSQTPSKAKLPQVIQTVISSLVTPDTETAANTLVLVGHGIHHHLARLEEMKIRLPNNMLVLDTMVLERSLYAAGWRGVMMDLSTGEARSPNTGLSLERLLFSFTQPPISDPQVDMKKRGRDSPLPMQVPISLPQCMLHNSGNDAFLTLFALQKLMEPALTSIPTVQKVHYSRQGHSNGHGMNALAGMMNPAAWGMNMQMMHTGGGLLPPQMPRARTSSGSGTPLGASTTPSMTPTLLMFPPGSTSQPFPHHGSQSLNPNMLAKAQQRHRSSYNLADEFGQMELESRTRKVSGVGQQQPTPPLDK